MQLLKNRIGSRGPLKRLAVGVVVGDELIDALHELFDAGERAAPDRFVGDQCKKALDLVQPGAVGRDEVHVPARSAGQPGLDLRMAVGGVVVHNAVDVQLGLHGRVNLAQERQEFLMPVARLASSQHGPIEHVQCRKQCGRAMALVVMGNPLTA